MKNYTYKAKIEELKKYEVNFKKGDVIINEGDFDKTFYYLISGKLSVIVNGEQLRIIVKPCSFFGEISSLCNTKRTASIIALTDVSCYALPSESLEQIISASPSFAIKLIRSLALSVKETTEHYSSKEILPVSPQKKTDEIESVFGWSEPEET